MARRLVATTIAACLAAALISCSDEGGSSEATEADEREAAAVVDEYFAAISEDDGARGCPLLTETAQAEAAEDAELLRSEGYLESDAPIESCEDSFSASDSNESNEKPEPPLIDPVGVEGDFAIAVVQFQGDREENLVYTLVREDGEWKLDQDGPIPEPGDLESDEDASQEASEVAAEISRESTDGALDPVIAVGDVALAYEPDGGSAPTLLVNEGNGWTEAEGIGLGVP